MLPPDQISLFPTKNKLNPIKPQPSFGQSAKIVFNLCDSIAERNWPLVLNNYNLFLQKRGDHYYLLAMINRLFRLMVLAKEEGLAKEKPFVREKAQRQGQKWSLGQLKTAYQKLTELEEQTKTGELDLNLGFLPFLQDLTQIS